MSKIRLDKYLADCGIGTRSEVKNLIKKGRVELNAKAARDPGLKVDVSYDTVCVDGQNLTYEEFRYFMLNKPQGCVSATRDGLSDTVLDILEDENTRDLFPVGRLDKDTEGLLLITNDGQLGHQLLSPKKHVDKTYIAMVSKELETEQLEQFAAGLDIGDDTPTLPARIALTNLTDHPALPADIAHAAVYEVVIHEGRYHQIKRMFEALASEVVFLKRVKMGSLELDPELEPGEYRRLSEEELKALMLLNF